MVSSLLGIYRDRLINGDPARVAIYCDFWPAALAADVRDDMRADIDVTPR